MKQVQDWQYEQEKLEQWIGSYDVVIRMMDLLIDDTEHSIIRRSGWRSALTEAKRNQNRILRLMK